MKDPNTNSEAYYKVPLKEERLENLQKAHRNNSSYLHTKRDAMIVSIRNEGFNWHEISKDC